MPVYLGLDFGTSGARVCVLAPGGEIEDMARLDLGALTPDEAAGAWREALFNLLAQLPVGLRKRLGAVAIDATSATVLACDAALTPLQPPLPYHDTRAVVEAALITRQAGHAHVASMPSSGLAKVLWLQARLGEKSACHYLNQADWLTALLCGEVVSDYHNALKLGADVQTGVWPDWLPRLVPVAHLPRLVPPGQGIATLAREHARALGIPADCLVRAGTTDSIAAFIAAGARQPGEAVTSLGTTLVLKLLSATRVDAARFGIYSHWFGGLWLTGGASNAGGGVLRQHFSDEEITMLSARIDPNRASGLDYYPLPRPGERFPVNDPHLPPRLTPVPAERGDFLHGMLEGLARIEAQGYARLKELGATPLSRVHSAGGGADNETYTRIRARLLAVPMAQAENQEASYGSALLACHGTEIFTRRRQ